nr:cysteine-rich receptor-like protein kinase 10 [Tanacetum cinerariifolium]
MMSWGIQYSDKATDDKPKDDTGLKTLEEPVNKEDQAYKDELDRLISQEKEVSDAANALRKEFEQECMDQKRVTKAGNTNNFNTVSNPVNAASTSGTFNAVNHHLLILMHSFLLTPYYIVGAEADFNNMKSSTVVSPILTHSVHIDHPKDQILGDPKSAVQTRRMAKKSSEAHDFISYIHKQRRTNHKDNEKCLFACLSQMEPKKVYRNKKDKKGIVVRNKASLVAQGHKQEEGIDYDEVFALVARIKAIIIFLAFASFMGFIFYQMDAKSAFIYGTIEEEVYNRYRRGTIDMTLFIKKDKDDIILVQVYVDDIIFGSTKKSLCDEFEAMMHKRFQMSSMWELTFFLGLQVPVYTKDFTSLDFTSLCCEANIFRYLKGQPKLGLWYPRDSPFDLEAYSNSDYDGANLDRKSTTGGCQFLGRRLISWECKKQTIVATFTTEAEYVSAANCYGQDVDGKPLKRLMIWSIRIVIVKWTRCSMKLQALWHQRVPRFTKALKVELCVVEMEMSTVESLKFDLSTIETATKNFFVDNKIGEGGFGPVYKGVLANGTEIAVKRLSKSSGQGSHEFVTEVTLMAKLQHRNLVRLLGFCLEDEERILIYEYVPNRSLDHFLF